MRFILWQRWLMAVSVLFMLAGAFLAVLNFMPFASLVNAIIDPAFYGSGSPDAPVRSYVGWCYAVLGGTIAGWGLTIFFLARNAFARREMWSRDAILLGTLLWFFIDTPLSAYYGVYYNVLINVIILALVLLPILFTWGEFKK